MGVHGVATRFAKVCKIWESFEALVEHREAGRAERISSRGTKAPFCEQVCSDAVLVDALSFFFALYRQCQGLYSSFLVGE